ncbi:MAG: SDR family NAD(P)-dependent oxidoreductase [Asgard group archaeon]|nr:SDR family NAD(P)-dependent oxidoreductase [Asgard group archaeon]
MSQPIFPRLSFHEWYQVLYGFWPYKPEFTEKNIPELYLKDKVVIITGGNSGIGYETAKLLAGNTDARIYIWARNENKSIDAINKIKLEIAEKYLKTTDNLKFIQVDLSDLNSIKPAVDKFLTLEDRLDIIFHNAGVMECPESMKTKQGYQMELGTNCLGPQLLQNLLDPVFLKTARTNPDNLSRIVWLSSSAHMFSPLGGMHLSDPEFKSTDVTLKTKYCQSKTINLIQARQWNINHPYSKAISISICPGYLKTGIQRHIGGFRKFGYDLLFHDQKFGAYTLLFAGLSPDVTIRNKGDHIISFGRFGLIRSDLKDDDYGKKIMNYIDEQIKQYK